MSPERVAAISSTEEASLLELLKTTFTDAFPNPRRIGCPDSGLRADLAVGRRDLRQHWDTFDHICQCSPCFVEYLALRKQHRRRVRAIGASGVAAVLISLAGAYVISSTVSQLELLATTELRRSIPRPPQPPEEALRPAVVDARLDFSHWTLYRSDASASSGRQPRALARGNLLVQIFLPLFSEPGRYRLILRRDTAAPLVEKTVQARLRNGDTILDRIKVDTSAITPGIYRLIVRREGASAGREFFVRIE
jgi:hypothetical protein